MNDIFKSLGDFGGILHVRVTAKAAANRVKVEDLADGTKLIRVYVTVAAEDGKANKAVLKILAKALKISPSSLSIIKGIASRDKTIAIKSL